MRRARAHSSVAAAVLAASTLGGCVYYNTIYNAERLYDDGEQHRRLGDDSLAEAAYRAVVRKAVEGYRRDPGGQWADDALLLMGRAHLRLGELRASRAALTEAAEAADDEPTRLAALVYLGAALAEAGHREQAAALLNEALEGLARGRTRADGHLERARLFFMAGNADRAWWDLDRAAELDRGVGFEAVLEGLRWGVRSGEAGRIGLAMRRLLTSPEGANRLATIVAMLRDAAERWGPGVAADALAGADSARWGGTALGRIRVERARLLKDAGREAEALEVARSVAEGFGIEAAEARLQLARWRLANARDFAEVESIAELLRPSADQQPVAELLVQLEELERLTTIGLQDPLGLFAAAEFARIRLGAPILARGLYLAYADGSPDAPWTPKALLAALAVSPAEGDREWLRGRLKARAASPYALAARGAAAPGLAELEEELARRIEEMGSR